MQVLAFIKGEDKYYKVSRNVGRRWNQKGKEEQATDTAIKAIEMGLNNEAITTLTRLTDKEINLLRRAKNN